jgi:hypothetical protein
MKQSFVRVVARGHSQAAAADKNLLDASEQYRAYCSRAYIKVSSVRALGLARTRRR